MPGAVPCRSGLEGTAAICWYSSRCADVSEYDMTESQWPDLDGPENLTPEELAARRLDLPDGQDFWVFGYGSLMWHHRFPPRSEVRIARLNGFHRSFCVFLPPPIAARRRCRGWCWGFDRGGSLPRAGVPGPRRRRRGGAGLPLCAGDDHRRLSPVLAGPPRQTRAAFRPSPSWSTAPTASMPAGSVMTRWWISSCRATAPARPCMEYLENTVHHLRALGLRDRALERLLKEAKARRAASGSSGSGTSDQGLVTS